jgi:hypothetical protein
VVGGVVVVVVAPRLVAGNIFFQRERNARDVPAYFAV